MKKIITLLLVLMAAFTFIACNEETSPESSKELSSDVTVGNIDVEVDDKTAPVPTEEYLLWKETLTSGSKTERIYEYNEKGHLVRVSHNYPDGRVEEDTYEYTYNDDGSYSVYQEGHLITDKLSTYDAEGRLIEEIENPNEVRFIKTTYEYSENMVEYKSVNHQGALRYWYKDTLNENGQVTKSENYIANGECIGYLLYIYDEKGNETAVEKYTANGEKNGGNPVYVWTEEYDEYGRVITKTKGIPETGGYASRVFYEYDEKGGLCKESSETGKYVKEYKPFSELVK